MRNNAVAMEVSSKYWKICRIGLSSKKGYEYQTVPLAQAFWQQQAIASQKANLQATLNAYFYTRDATKNRAIAGLCLRCYVSYPILKACQMLDNLFGGTNFTYQDLLPFVLNDDGKSLRIIDKDGKTQLVLNNQEVTAPSTYPLFTLEILRTYKPNSPSSMSLENWAYLQTKQNKELKNFLSEFGFKHLSDWALLNKVRAKQLERLSDRDRHLITAFHAVYRRDRLGQRQKGIKKCPDPSESQLQEMRTCLQEQKIVFNSTGELLKFLKQIAIQLRQYDIWSYRESLETYDPETGNYSPRADLPKDFSNEADELEGRELLIFLQDSLKIALDSAIAQALNTQVENLTKSKNYAIFAPQFIPGLRLYYGQGMSLAEIAPQLGMSNWDRARRILNPGDLLQKIRMLTVQQLLDTILEKAKEMGLTKIPPEPDYLKTVSEQIEVFIDREIFQEAAAEIRAGKNRSLDSLYAKKLLSHLDKY
ncbi:MAG: hypothetical protein MUD14_01210 [Hydrococcus sp. Prado102]|jgi:hypothetical protein|nr:hypothetical protein [Hydrococcus sp. Prado102]